MFTAVALGSMVSTFAVSATPSLAAALHRGQVRHERLRLLQELSLVQRAQPWNLYLREGDCQTPN